ncbi:hypothetical protein NDU88_010991 [Pleurodeles waltl]|uniref:Uncharacterized protein n=1 Tax=Pleurodeles waltl TaxID=8319 RepID=A0AAV7R0B4_PLEWA|nr:hypothetical protein NDU88_010991 [Pleurodeles waltl]
MSIDNVYNGGAEVSADEETGIGRLAVDNAIDTELFNVVSVYIITTNGAVNDLIVDLTSGFPDVCEGSELGFLMSVDTTAFSEGVDGSETDVFCLGDP